MHAAANPWRASATPRPPGPARSGRTDPPKAGWTAKSTLPCVADRQLPTPLTGVTDSHGHKYVQVRGNSGAFEHWSLSTNRLSHGVAAPRHDQRWAIGMGTSLEDGVAWRFWKGIIGFLGGGAAGSAAAQDYTAGKTPAQLFQSDCSACHKTPQGLSRGMDQRSLAGFLREHYTTKQESAGALAAYVASTGGGGQRPPAGAAGQNPRPTVVITESEPGQKP